MAMGGEAADAGGVRGQNGGRIVKACGYMIRSMYAVADIGGTTHATPHARMCSHAYNYCPLLAMHGPPA